MVALGYFPVVCFCYTGGMYSGNAVAEAPVAAGVAGLDPPQKLVHDLFDFYKYLSEHEEEVKKKDKARAVPILAVGLHVTAAEQRALAKQSRKALRHERWVWPRMRRASSVRERPKPDRKPTPECQVHDTDERLFVAESTHPPMRKLDIRGRKPSIDRKRT
ncbi:hypothetical protein [Caballeronia calidae]|uniref:hypothetical protein n=1 Tax=Caballeronia calidae TaxID=1777139 RepID=UPI0012FD0F90|nr:hypothetical protein [Caballeronia calidae]